MNNKHEPLARIIVSNNKAMLDVIVKMVEPDIIVLFNKNNKFQINQVVLTTDMFKSLSFSLNFNNLHKHEKEQIELKTCSNSKFMKYGFRFITIRKRDVLIERIENNMIYSKLPIEFKFIPSIIKCLQQIYDINKASNKKYLSIPEASKIISEEQK